ncbi:MAG: hypothetical protein WC844_04735 [Patescibacteria group bacterium]
MKRKAVAFEQYAELGCFGRYHEAGRLSTGFIARELGLMLQHGGRLLKRTEPPRKRLS